MSHRRLIHTSLFLLALTLVGCGGGSSPATGDPKLDGTKEPLNGTGCTCDQITVTVQKEPAAPIASPAAGSPDANRVLGGAYVPGGAPQKIEVKVDGPKDECCAKVTVGLVQALVKMDFHAEYSGGGRITNQLVDPRTHMPINLPLCDSDPVGEPGSGYPYYGPEAKSQAKKCGDVVKFEFLDQPDPGFGGFPKEKNGQRLNKVVFNNDYRLFLVWECPLGSYKILRTYDWNQRYELTIDYSFDPPKGRLKSSGEETGRGNGVPGNAPTAPTTTGPVPNDAGTQPQSPVSTGF